MIKYHKISDVKNIIVIDIYDQNWIKLLKIDFKLLSNFKIIDKNIQKFKSSSFLAKI